MFGPDMFKGDDVREVAKNLLGCVLHFPQSSFPVKQGTITEVQWYDVEEKDPETTEDKQGDALLMDPGKVYIFEAMGPIVILVSALNDKTRACVRINAIPGIADRAHLLARRLGLSNITREKYQGQDILDQNSLLYITAPEVEIPEPEIFLPRLTKVEKGMRITI